MIEKQQIRYAKIGAAWQRKNSLSLSLDKSTLEIIIKNDQDLKLNAFLRKNALKKKQNQPDFFIYASAFEEFIEDNVIRYRLIEKIEKKGGEVYED